MRFNAILMLFFGGVFSDLPIEGLPRGTVARGRGTGTVARARPRTEVRGGGKEGDDIDLESIDAWTGSAD